MRNKFSYYIYIFIILSSLSFYNPFGLISPQLSKLLFYLACILGIIYAIKNGINLNKVDYPRSAYRVILIGIIISIFMATIFQKQSFETTAIATLPYFFAYSLLYTLLKFNIPKPKIEHAIWFFCFMGMGIYIINILTFPKCIFGAEQETFDMSRGIVRLKINSLQFIVLFLFYSINQWIITQKKKYIWLIALNATFIVLSVTRQYIFLSATLGLIFILQKSSWLTKISIITCCVLFYYVVLPEIPIYQTMVELSEKQVQRNEEEQEDIRIRAWKFYSNEYQTNNLTRFLGNGVPSFGNSTWGNKHERTVVAKYGGNGCYTVDVGWAGFYWYFGILSTLGLLYLLLKAASIPKGQKYQYLSYWCVFIILTSIASGPILYYYQTVSIMTVLYLIYGNKSESCKIKKLQSTHPY